MKKVNNAVQQGIGAFKVLYTLGVFAIGAMVVTNYMEKQGIEMKLETKQGQGA